MASSTVKLYVRLPDGAMTGPFDVSEVRDSFLQGKFSTEAMIRQEGDPVLWNPIKSVFEANTSLNQSLRRLERERGLQRLSAWLKVAAWIFVANCVTCLVVFLGLGMILREWTKGPSWNEQRVAPVKKAERQAREVRFKDLTQRYNAVINRLEFSKQREKDCNALLNRTKTDREEFKAFVELGTKVVRYHLELGSMNPEKLRVLEAEALALPSPWWLYFGAEGLDLYLADAAALQFASLEREAAYRQAVIAYEKAGAVQVWTKKQQYLDLQMEAVKSVLD